jgi:hypothetical protein
MTASPADGFAERYAVAALDHFARKAGYRAVPAPRPDGGGWRRVYLSNEPRAPVLCAVAPEGSRWVSLGVEVPVARDALTPRLPEVLLAVAPFEVAVDPDAGAERGGAEAVLRIALRLFVEGLCESVVADAAANLSEAESEARRAMGSTT